ncbi:MAG: hypothetical protein AAF439_15925 [Pseudomonadota bacterium]
MYDQDSFFDLTTWGQIGLFAISTALFMAMLLAARAIFYRRALPVRVAGALILFWIFVWASPQIYYQYYMVIIDDLPWQWVIKTPGWPTDTISLLFFQGPHNLSAHGKGLLGWSLIALVVFRPFPQAERLA